MIILDYGKKYIIKILIWSNSTKLKLNTVETRLQCHQHNELKELTDLKKEKKWLKEVDSCALQKCVFNLDDAFKNFFRGNGYPRFRRKGEHESYTTNNILNEYKNIKYESIRIDLKNKVITLPRLKKIEFRGYRKIKK